MRGTLPVCALAIIFLLTKTTLGQSGPNIARGRPAVQSSEDPSSPYPAGLAVDGSTNQNLAGGSCARTDPVQKPAWWRVDLGRLYDVGLVRIYNRGDCCGEALDGFTVYIGEEVKGDASATHQTTNCGDGYVSAPTTGQIIYATCLGAKGRYVWIYNPSGNLTLCEVQIYEYEPPPTIGRLRNVSSYPGGVGGTPRGDLGRRHNRYFYYSSGHYIYRADFVYGGTISIAGWYYGYSNSDGRYSRFRSPQGIAVNEYTTCNNYYSPCAYIYVADYSNHVIRRVEATGWSRSRYTRVYTQAGTGGAGCKDGPTGSSQFYYPTDVSYYNSRIYVADQYCNRIRRIYGSVQSVAGSGTSGYADGPGTAAKLYRPTAVDVWRTGTNGVVYIVEQASHRIRQWDGATNVVTTVGALAPVGSTATCLRPSFPPRSTLASIRTAIHPRPLRGRNGLQPTAHSRHKLGDRSDIHRGWRRPLGAAARRVWLLRAFQKHRLGQGPGLQPARHHP